MFKQYQTEPVITLCFMLGMVALAAFGLAVAIPWSHRGGWAIVGLALYSLKAFRRHFMNKDAR